MLISQATGGNADNQHYQALRLEFLNNHATKQCVPRFVRTNRDLSQFWQFIKHKFPSYAERRQFIWEEFNPLLEQLESGSRAPADTSISDALGQLSESGVQGVWSKALERRVNDPEGAITSARTLLETTCKHILDELQVGYDSNAIELHELYKLVAKELTLSPDQHNEKVFKQILGGCSGIVSGLGTLRNRLGDAHGKGKLPAKPAPRHAELAVNLAGSVSMFLIATYRAKSAL
ncbi:abortive infection family protein [bacterium]|nr:abortive infection family protein [bacterium]